MGNRINIIYTSEIKGRKKLIFETMEELLKIKGMNKKTNVSVVVTDDEDIKEINRNFRKRDNATTVLSFPLINKVKFVQAEDTLFLGDIIINMEEINRREDCKKVIKEYLIHGFLHLLKYSHKAMEREESKLLRRLNDIKKN